MVNKTYSNINYNNLYYKPFTWTNQIRSGSSSSSFTIILKYKKVNSNNNLLSSVKCAGCHHATSGLLLFFKECHLTGDRLKKRISWMWGWVQLEAIAGWGALWISLIKGIVKSVLASSLVGFLESQLLLG